MSRKYSISTGLAGLFGVVVAGFSIWGGAVVAGTAGNAAFSPERYLGHIKYLASPEMRGRLTGSPELEKAAQYIAGQFRADGLKPLDGKSYLQPFDVTTSAKLGRNNRFDAVMGQETRTLQPGRDFVPFNFSSHGKATASVVFAGYGITAPEYNYDDYAGIEVRDKFVLVLSHEPQEYDE